VGLSRREVLGAGAAALALQRVAPARAAATRAWPYVVDFSALGDGEGWPGWACPGVANVRRGGGQGRLEAGSDVFPCDPRPVAFAVDRRFRDGEITAQLAATGAGAGVVLRRTGPRDYVAAIYDDEQGALLIVRRTPDGAATLAQTAAERPARLTFSAYGPRLEAATEAARVTVDDHAFAHAGDAGVLATARTLYPSSGPAVLPALGNLHLL
jgi:hypothetical protein